MTPGRDSKDHTQLGPGGEFDLVRRMLSRFGDAAEGIGDDAAIVAWAGDGKLVVSTDTSVENVHFRKDWLTYQEIGYRATAAALSDLAAMAATPVAVFLAVTLSDADVQHVEEIADGVAECVTLAGTRIHGGDISRGAHLSLTLTVVGSAARPLLRGAARAGDRVYVTGALGGPFAALREFQAGREPAEEHRRRFARPAPRLRESLWLAERGARAGIDISDGLVADARHVAVASGVILKLRSENVPVAAGTTLDDALASGEEYELLVTSADVLDLSAFRREFAVGLTEIGEVTAGDSVGVELTARGQRIAAPPGYDHFAA